jgi:hypothetical protein
LVAFETSEGLQLVFVKGLPVCPLRLTLRGRRELPVKVENIAGSEERQGRAQGPEDSSDCTQDQMKSICAGRIAMLGMLQTVDDEVKLTLILRTAAMTKGAGELG